MTAGGGGSQARPGPAPSSARAEAAVLARRLAALEEGPVRVRAAARALASPDASAAAAVVAALVRATAPPLRSAAAAVAQALGDPRDDLPYEWLADLYAAATGRGLTEVTALLVAPPPHRAWREPRDKADARLAHLTLGHKNAFARAQRDPDLLARLAAEGEPAVVRELLRNPQLTEEFVVRIAARRPCRPGTLRCVFESPRWRMRSAVALAIARNPYVETAIALELLSGLAAVDLREISRDATVHPLVRAVALRIAAQRLP
jgi:DNA-directed RNA polymerase subunit F